ncbi:glycosyltransferase [Actinomadura atramentaria]|uniref:glycosyltransferase n=1 Tax=Actinomadura atramentaria TaxID=1990 RepID=UPI0003623260|nr:glycosyltransferase [Actinomadura atramentaria]
MRVLHVITGLGRGGAERQLAALLARRAEPVVSEVAVLTGCGPLAAEIRALGVPVHEIGMRGNRDFAALPRLVRLMRDGRYDVVHTHLYRACVYGRIAARIAGVRRIIATEHSLGDGEIEGRRAGIGVRLLYRATERLGTLTVAVSPTVAARLRGWGVPDSRIVTVPNGVDAAAFAFDPARRAEIRAALGVAATETVVGCVGRLVPGKRTDLLVRAFAGAAVPGAWLVVAGDGPERGALERLARRLGVASRVRFLGDTADVPGVLAALDVYAAPSRQETFGLGVVEAMAAGLPVLYTTCPALDDVPASLAPHARRLRADLVEWAAALARFPAPDPVRLPVAPVVGGYDLGATARALHDLYGPAAHDPRTHPAKDGPRTWSTTGAPSEVSCGGRASRAR